jgi:hypothetical protein
LVVTCNQRGARLVSLDRSPPRRARHTPPSQRGAARSARRKRGPQRLTRPR